MTETWAEELAAACADCQDDRNPAGWSHIWARYLCYTCRARRTDTELRVKLAAKGKALPAEPVLRL